MTLHLVPKACEVCGADTHFPRVVTLTSAAKSAPHRADQVIVYDVCLDCDAAVRRAFLDAITARAPRREVA